MNRNHLNFAHLLLLTISILLVINITQASPSCNQICLGSSHNPLPFPFGFSDGCHIRLNCSSNGDILIGEFQVQNVTTDSLLLRVLPNCSRSIKTLIPLFSSTYALTWKNGLLLQHCTFPQPDCVIPKPLLQTQFEFGDCGPPSCFSAKEGDEGESFMTYANVSRSGCKFLYSSVTVENSSSLVSLEFRTLQLGWWLEGACNCSSNASCNEIVSPANQRRGFQCRCLDGYEGDGYRAGRGCWKATSHCNPNRYMSGKCGGTTRIAVLIGGVVAGASLMAGLAFLCFTIRRRSTASKIRKSTKELLSEAEGSCSVPFYRYKEMKRATYGFSEKHRLGTGAYGTVYAGKLNNDEWVAIKRIRYRDQDSIEQVVNEIKLLSSVKHPNLVRLLGFCIERGEQILVYEFMPNGTLSQHLQRERGTGLSWPVRLAIASETAQAITHLHFALDPPIYHRDIKSSNILLDLNFNSKVADFGLSRLGMTELSHISTVPQGTPGYLDPQYHQNFHLSDRSDVYSFGVVLLEIITGMKVVDFSRPPNEVNLAAFAMEKIRKGCLDEIIDPFLDQHKDAWTLSSLHKVAELAFRCLAFHSETRPSMMEVAAELEHIRFSGCAPLKEEDNICIRSSLDSCCSSPCNGNEKLQDVSVKKVVVEDLKLVVPQIHSYVFSTEELRDCSPVSVQEIWLTDESSPSTNSLLFNVVH
ncbi:Protein kinase domain [Macleaya cordata]|uniref:Protein kinase domain n=1 Tax=Macleaya cordata TaxID=56857 RepID=A0A200R796_MACCD|nr:Protein kinase domain [Macleaya cordata]